MAVLDADTAVYRYLEALPAKTKMTVYTKRAAGARTNVVAVLQKEEGFGDWQVVSRPATADAAQLPEAWPHEPGAISARTLADTFKSNRDLWADVNERSRR